MYAAFPSFASSGVIVFASSAFCFSAASSSIALRIIFSASSRFVPASAQMNPRSL